jgi:protein-tyrosine phosphatase
MVGDAGLEADFGIDSAGTIGFHKGKPPDSRMAAHLAKKGYKVAGRSRQLTPDDLREFDLILTMDEENFTDALSLDPAGEFRHKVKPFADFLKLHDEPRIPDPYYGGDAGFAHVIDLLEDGCSELLDRLSLSSK